MGLGREGGQPQERKEPARRPYSVRVNRRYQEPQKTQEQIRRSVRSFGRTAGKRAFRDSAAQVLLR